MALITLVFNNQIDNGLDQNKRPMTEYEFRLWSIRLSDSFREFVHLKELDLDLYTKQRGKDSISVYCTYNSPAENNETVFNILTDPRLGVSELYCIDDKKTVVTGPKLEGYK